MFMDENGKVDCNLLDKIYYYRSWEAIGGPASNTRGGRLLHCFAPDSELPQGAPTYVVPTECTLNESESKIFVSDNYDEEVMQEQGWLKICHYGNQYLKFNKLEYETELKGGV